MVNDLLGRPWAPAVTPATAAVPAVPAGGKPPPVVLPNPPPLDDETLTVDDAWALFGIPQKRSTKDEVKRRYLAFAAKWHPDKHPDDEATANGQLARANAAWALLQKYCKW